KQTHQRFADVPDRGLSGTPRRRFPKRSVKAILQYIEVERAQLHDAEIIYAVINPVESELVVPADDLCANGRCTPQHVLIERFHLLERHSVSFRIKVIQIAENVTEQAVADLLIGLRHALHEALGAHD